MGSSHSSKPSAKSPAEELEKLKLESGNVSMKPAELRNRDAIRGKAISEGETNVRERKVVEKEKERKNGSSNGGGKLINNAEEDELVDGWPKWLVHNIPADVLKNIVPKSADSYTKIDKVGQGTYSNVYKARDKDTGKMVALKKVRFDTSEPESVKFMAREIMILQKLDHPNIVKLEGLATSRMQYSIYLVFDYMHSDLSRILGERLTEPQIKCYMQQLLSGLQHCHEKGILHRDIKGANLLIDRNGMLKIADFGLANVFNTEKRRPLTNRVVTLWYRAPELLLGSTDYGVGIDLWSAGCLMAEMIVGRPIMPARTEVEQLHRIFKLCGTPTDDYYKSLKLSTALRPPQAYKPALREAFKNLPWCSLDLLSTLLSLEPHNRGSATSALQHKFFHTSPFACDLSGLPKIHIEDDDNTILQDRRKQRSAKMRRRSQSQREQRKKNSVVENPKADNKISKEETQTRAEAPSSSKSTFFPRAEAPSTVNKNRPPLPAKERTTNYSAIADGASRSDVVRRSASTREFRSLENKERTRRAFD